MPTVLHQPREVLVQRPEASAQVASVRAGYAPYGRHEDVAQGGAVHEGDFHGQRERLRLLLESHN